MKKKILSTQKAEHGIQANSEVRMGYLLTNLWVMEAWAKLCERNVEIIRSIFFLNP